MQIDKHKKGKTALSLTHAQHFEITANKIGDRKADIENNI